MLSLAGASSRCADDICADADARDDSRAIWPHSLLLPRYADAVDALPYVCCAAFAERAICKNCLLTMLVAAITRECFDIER